MDRRQTIKWMLATSTVVPSLQQPAWGADPQAGSPTPTTMSHAQIANGYGADPKLLKVHQPGDLWPLTLTAEQRRTTQALSDLIIPADATSPSASQVGIVDFLDEWISAPYSQQRQDRILVLWGFGWLDEQSVQRFSKTFAALTHAQQRTICNDICLLQKAAPKFIKAAKFFARYRDLSAGGYYTTPEGRKDLQFVGNTPAPSFAGPPPELLKKLGLSEDS